MNSISASLTKFPTKTPFEQGCLVSSMESNLPEPPKGWPQYLKDDLTKQDPSRLREIATFADELALARLGAGDSEHREPDETPAEWDDELDDAYDELEIPRGKGTVTVNMIDGRGYYYLKGSHDGEFFSQYIAPVEPKSCGSD